jgi:ADP-ribosylglycohydrolase
MGDPKITCPDPDWVNRSVPFPDLYNQRVYAGVLGKMIGVYLGRPVEGWGYETIAQRFGEVRSYVHEQVGAPLVVTDDDLAGTFTFLRALEDNGYPIRIEAAQVGSAWLNYIIEGRTILWWGGLYHSTEHTAYIRLKEGIQAPQSGSLALNGPVIANQIGAQIYIDGYAMVAPGDPLYAAHLARTAASVSHDDEAIHAAQVIAAMEAQAFIEPDIHRLIETGLAQIPPGSLISRMIESICAWQIKDQDWRVTRQRIVQEYGYKKYPGGCHIVPNHALIQLGLLYGAGDFRKSLAICVTSGWDTDCNAGNLGCLLGIRNGLDAFRDCDDLRFLVADRLFLSTADGGRCITDAVLESYHIIHAARALKNMAPEYPKQGAAGLGSPRFHFELDGSVQGFVVKTGPGFAQAALNNQKGHSRWGQRCLAITFENLRPEQPVQAGSATFILPEDLGKQDDYELIASPTLYPGQTVKAGLSAAENNAHPINTCLYLRYYDADDQPAYRRGRLTSLQPGDDFTLTWCIPDTGGGPIYEIGIEVLAVDENESPVCGTVYLDFLGWDGTPDVTFTRPKDSAIPHPGPLLFRRAWVDAVDHWDPWYRQSFRIVQDYNRGLISIGTREWMDYQVSAAITSCKFNAGGIAARVQGLQRFYALMLVEGGILRLVKSLDGDSILAEIPFPWEIWRPYAVKLVVQGDRLQGWIDGKCLLEARDQERPLMGGGVALVVERGHLAAPAVSVSPLSC